MELEEIKFTCSTTDSCTFSSRQILLVVSCVRGEYVASLRICTSDVSRRRGGDAHLNHLCLSVTGILSSDATSLNHQRLSLQN